MAVRRLAVALIAFVCCLSAHANAIAHPLGNFTINHLAKISATSNRLNVRYMLDIAEIPTFQIMHAASPSGTWSNREPLAWTQAELSGDADGLDITVDCARVALTQHDASSRLRRGAGHMAVMNRIRSNTRR